MNVSPPIKQADSRGPRAPRAGDRFAPAAFLATVGMCCIVLGGLVAAVTSPLDLAHGSWVAAYLVLVGGVAQYLMGRARPLRQEEAQRRWAWTQFGVWNLGNAGVIIGTLAGQTLPVAVGSVALFVGLAIALHAARPSALPSHGPVSGPFTSWAYRALLVALAISIPVGVALSYIRDA